jgi:hypothetical protein
MIEKKALLLIGVVGLIAGFIGGITSSIIYLKRGPEITTSRLNLVDKEGKKRGSFYCSGKDQNPRFVMGNIRESSSIVLSCDDTSSEIWLSSKEGNSLELLTGVGETRIKLLGSGDNPFEPGVRSALLEQVVLSVDTKERTPSIQLFDKDGNLRVSFGSIDLKKKESHYKSPPSSIYLFDAKEKLIWQAPPSD